MWANWLELLPPRTRFTAGTVNYLGDRVAPSLPSAIVHEIVRLLSLGKIYGALLITVPNSSR